MNKRELSLFAICGFAALLGSIMYLLGGNGRPNDTGKVIPAETPDTEKGVPVATTAPVEFIEKAGITPPGHETVTKAEQPAMAPQVSPPVTQVASVMATAGVENVEEDVSVPLVFVNPPREFVPSEEEQNVLDSMRQKFIEDVGEPGNDPAAYRKRWNKAQQRQDAQFQAMFGDEAFNALQQEAVLAQEKAE